MPKPEKISLLQAASYIDWWKLAGADYQVDTLPVNWLQDNHNVAVAPMLADVILTTQPVQAKSPIPSEENPPGYDYGGKQAIPIGDKSARLMIVSDLPDPEDIAAGLLGEGPSGKLLRKMIAAIGTEFSDCYFTALAHSRPATGDIPDTDLPALAAFALHQIALVKPEMVLILGSVACQALLGAELMTARGNLHYFNHDGQKVSVIVTFHPRTLLARPILKAQAWKDLQMLNFKDAL